MQSDKPDRQLNIYQNGQAAFIIPVMVEQSYRITEATTQMIFEFLMSQTLIHRDFEKIIDFSKIP